MSLSSILHDLVVRFNLPSNINNFDIRTVVCSLEKSIHPIIFNFNTFVSNLDAERVLQENTIHPCDYEGSKFIDHYHKHNLIDNLKITRHKKLRKLFTKMPKCQENRIILFEKAKLDITAGMNKSIESWCTKYGRSRNLFNE